MRKSSNPSPRLRNFKFNPERGRGSWLGPKTRRELVNFGVIGLTSLFSAILVSLGGPLGLSLWTLVGIFVICMGAGAFLLTEFPSVTNPDERILNVLRLCGVTLTGVVLGRLVVTLGWPAYVIPLPLLTAVVTIAFGRRLALLHAWSLCALVGILVARWQGQQQPLIDVSFTFSMGVACTTIAFFCDKIMDRGSLLRAGLVSGLVLLVAAFVARGVFDKPSLEKIFQQHREASLATERSGAEIDRVLAAGLKPSAEMYEAYTENKRGVWRAYVDFLRNSFWGFINCAFSGFFLYEILWWIERFFGVVTRLHLVKLADLNNPLLRRLNMEAPGTYHHSQMVARLCEASAEAIGADSLLARVGAYYHDIGKMAKPRYFTENNPTSPEIHGLLNPTLSALVIHAHVKDGIELGRSLGLPEKVVDFIPEHHGTTACEFFYRQAVDLAREQGLATPDKEMFRYPGPRPRSKETSIVLIADSVEAATRSLKSPTPARIRTLVHEILIDKLLDHQFADSPITLGELLEVEETLVRKLTWMHHARIKYPKKVQTAQQARLKELDKERWKEQNKG